MQREVIHIYDFGSQYTQLIARRIRELDVYCEVHPYYNTPPLSSNVKGVILSGSPSSILNPDAPLINTNTYRKNIPLLGICYGAQLIAHQAGGKISFSKKREYGRAYLHIEKQAPIVKKYIYQCTSVDVSRGYNR